MVDIEMHKSLNIIKSGLQNNFEMMRFQATMVSRTKMYHFIFKCFQMFYCFKQKTSIQKPDKSMTFLNSMVLSLRETAALEKHVAIQNHP